LRGVFHCFTGTAEHAARIIELGDFYLGIGGVVTYPKGGLAETMALVGPEHCVLETDAPYLSPAPHRGAVNTPLLIEHTFAQAAVYLGVGTEELELLIEANAKELFALKAEEGVEQSAGS